MIRVDEGPRFRFVRRPDLRYAQLVKKLSLLAAAIYAASAFIVAPVVRAQSPPLQTFSGVVTDSECAGGDHSGMRMGDTAAECARACMEYHSATLVLFDGKTSRRLDDQKVVTPFAGQKVTVVGTLDEATGTITVKTIASAK